MKKKYSGISILLSLLLLFSFSCSSESRKDEGSGLNTSAAEPVVTELSLNETASRKIDKEGDVDWFHFFADGTYTNKTLRVKATSNTYRPDVDLLVTVYTEDDSGKKIVLFGEQSPENSKYPADIAINVKIDKPMHIWISVRDFKDDDFSDNPYFITIDSESDKEGNDRFTDDLVALKLDSENGCQIGEIGYINDVDIYRINVNSGIYDINTIFTPINDDSDVNLIFNLYNSKVKKITSLATYTTNDYHIIPYLDTGEYFLEIYDDGKNDFDNASSYKVCLNSVAGEAKLNDSKDTASTVTDLTSIAGSLDYYNDQDWYKFSVNSQPSIINFTFTDTFTEEVKGINYLISIEDSNGEKVMERMYASGAGQYQTLIKTETAGQHYLLVRPFTKKENGELFIRSAPYSASITINNLESDVPNNENDALDLTPDTTPGEKTYEEDIAYIGDLDYFTVTVDRSVARILEISLTTVNTTTVDYLVTYRRDVEGELLDFSGEDFPTELKTGILIEEGLTPATITIRVSDLKDNDADDSNPYTLKVSIVDVPDDSGTMGVTECDHIYYSEVQSFTANDCLVSETEETSSENITLRNIITSDGKEVSKGFKANTTLVNFQTDPIDMTTDDVRTETIDGVVVYSKTISSPLIKGYIDYQGDRDWFQFLNKPLVEARKDPADPANVIYKQAAVWYYDIKVELQADFSATEYTLEYFRNNSLNYSRALISTGDNTLATNQLNMSFPDPADPNQYFWVGNRWEGESYFSISDFNYIKDPQTGAINPNTDDDWGYEAPYSFKVIVTYHSGVSSPTSDTNRVVKDADDIVVQ